MFFGFATYQVYCEATMHLSLHALQATNRLRQHQTTSGIGYLLLRVFFNFESVGSVEKTIETEDHWVLFTVGWLLLTWSFEPVVGAASLGVFTKS